jgi:hypothetical protein
MGTMLQDTGGEPRELAPAGNHRATCCGVIDLGTQTFEFNGESKSMHKLMLRFELSDECDAEGRPILISREFTASLHEKAALRAFLESWRGRPFGPEELKGFDPSALLGQPCLVGVIHEVSRNGKTYANIKSVGRLPKGMAPPEPVADQVHYQIEDGDPPSELPDWIVRKIRGCAEMAPNPTVGPARRPPEPGVTVAYSADDDNIPF